MRILVLTLAIGSLLILPSLTNAQKYANDDSLILYMPFNEGEGDTALDWTRLGNHGKLEGPPQWVQGKHGKALEFDGDDDVVIIETKDSKELQLHESPGTAECWFLMKGEESPPPRDSSPRSQLLTIATATRGGAVLHSSLESMENLTSNSA